MGETMKGAVSIPIWKAAIQSKEEMTMTRDIVWNRPLSSGTLPFRSRRKMHSRGWTRCRGNSMDSFGSFVAALRVSEAKVGQNHQHSVSCRSLWKIGIDRSCIMIQRGLLIQVSSTGEKRRTRHIPGFPLDVNDRERSQMRRPTRVHPPLGRQILEVGRVSTRFGRRTRFAGSVASWMTICTKLPVDISFKCPFPFEV